MDCGKYVVVTPHKTCKFESKYEALRCLELIADVQGYDIFIFEASDYLDSDGFYKIGSCEVRFDCCKFCKNK